MNCIEIVRRHGLRRGTGQQSHLARFIREILAGYRGSYRDALLVTHPVNPDFPGEILQKEQYKHFNRMQAKAATIFT